MSDHLEPCRWCDGKGEVQAERNFLLLRMTDGDSSWVGLSSTAMLAQVLSGAPHPSRWPGDEGDLARCEETYRRAPKHLQPALLVTLERFRRHVEVGGLYCEGCDTSGHNYTARNRCRACQEAA